MRQGDRIEPLAVLPALAVFILMRSARTRKIILRIRRKYFEFFYGVHGVLCIQSVITSHTFVAPQLVAAAYVKSMPYSSFSSRLGLLCSDALYAILFMSLCIKMRREL